MYINPQNYEARRQTVMGTFKFVADADPKTFSYDADTKLMQVSVPVGDHIFLGQSVPKRATINVHAIKRSERKYIGSNAFGAQADVTSTITDFYGVLVSQSIESPLLFPIDAIAVQSVKPFLRFGFICTLAGNTVVEDTFANAPTIELPYGIYHHYSYVPVMITELFAVDSRDGKVLVQVHTGSSADAATQRQMRNKSLPITLEIRGLGAVYLSIDGQPEQIVQPGFLNEAVMFRARRQIRMRLSTRYDKLEMFARFQTRTTYIAIADSAI